MSTPTAAPLRVSAAYLSDELAEQLGYLYVAICRHCHEKIVIRNDEPPYMVKPAAWRHRDHDDRRTCPERPLRLQREWEARHPELINGLELRRPPS